MKIEGRRLAGSYKKKTIVDIYSSVAHIQVGSKLNGLSTSQTLRQHPNVASYRRIALFPAAGGTKRRTKRIWGAMYGRGGVGKRSEREVMARPGCDFPTSRRHCTPCSNSRSQRLLIPVTRWPGCPREARRVSNRGTAITWSTAP